MNVGFVVYGDIETTSGGFLYDRKLIAGLRERGDTVTVVELPWSSYPRGLLDGGVRRFRGLGEEFGSERFDVLVEDELAHPTLLGCNPRLRRRYDCPIVTVVHHLRCSEARSPLERTVSRATERRYLRGVDGAICNSAFTRETVTDLADVPTLVAPPAGNRFDPAIDAEAITERAHEGPLNLLFVGNVVPRKELHTLIEGLARLPDERWRLRVAGDTGANPTYVRRVHRTISRLGVGDRVSMLGAVADDELEAALRESHLLAIPSTHEGFGIAYLEGMGFGLPALASTAGGARDVVTHGETGFLCSPGNVGGITRRVRALADDRDRLARMGSNARERYEAWPSWAESAANVGPFLDRIVAGETRGGRAGNEGDETEKNREDKRALA